MRGADWRHQASTHEKGTPTLISHRTFAPTPPSDATERGTVSGALDTDHSTGTGRGKRRGKTTEQSDTPAHPLTPYGEGGGRNRKAALQRKTHQEGTHRETTQSSRAAEMIRDAAPAARKLRWGAWSLWGRTGAHSCPSPLRRRTQGLRPAKHLHSRRPHWHHPAHAHHSVGRKAEAAQGEEAAQPCGRTLPFLTGAHTAVACFSTQPPERTLTLTRDTHATATHYWSKNYLGVCQTSASAAGHHLRPPIPMGFQGHYWSKNYLPTHY